VAETPLQINEMTPLILSHYNRRRFEWLSYKSIVWFICTLWWTRFCLFLWNQQQ